MTDNNKELESLRHKINDVTIEMVNLFLKRNKIAADIGCIKKDMGKNITDDIRKSQIHKNILQTYKNQKNIKMSKNITAEQTEQYITKFLNYLINESTSVQIAEVEDSKYQNTTVVAAATTHLSVFAKAKEMEKAGKNIIHMEVGEPNFQPPHIVKDALAESYDAGYTKYDNPQGMQEFLDALAVHASKKFNAAKQLSAKNVIVTPGGRFAVFAAMSTILKPNDEVIITRPAWPAYQDCARHLNARVYSIDTTIQDSWTPQISKIVNAINKNTKMIILNYPNNPTGKILSTDVMDEIIKIASENNLYVLSDEIYADYTIATKPQKSVISYKYDKCIAIQSFSKSHAMTGLRIGYAMTADHSIIDKMKTLSALCLTSVAAPIQYAALRALDADTRQNANIMRARLDILVQKIRQMNLEFINPDGGMYIFARMPSNVKDTVVFADKILKKYGIAIAPGVGFGDSYRDFIRISAACEGTQRLEEGTDKLMSMIKEW